MKTVKFTEMKKGSKEDYELLAEYEKNYVNELPDRILESLKNLDNSVDGYQVSRLEHSLQSATRAEKDGADEEMIVATLLHDIGDSLAPIQSQSAHSCCFKAVCLRESSLDYVASWPFSRILLCSSFRQG